MRLKKLFSIIILGAVCISLFFFYNRGIILYDEGYMLHASERIIQGEVLYKDFHFLYTPFTVYSIALAFKLFGVSVYTGRLLGLITALITSYLIYKLVSSFRKVDQTLVVLAVAIYVAWGPSHINFSYPVVFAFMWCIVLLLCIFKAVEKSPISWWFYSGMATALVFLSKQSFGIAALATLVFSLLIYPRSKQKKYVAIFFAPIGLALCLGLYGIYLAYTHTLGDFVYETLQFPLTHFLGRNIMTTPFIYPGVWYRQIVRLLWYSTPFLIAVYGFWLSTGVGERIKKIKSQIIFLLIAVFYVVGIRPTTDYVHLVPLLAMTGVGISLCIYLEKNRLIRLLFWSFGILLCIFGFITALWYHYYRWETPLDRQTIYVANARVGIFTDTKYSQAISAMSKWVGKYTKNPYIFIYHNRSMLYFILDKKNPTRFFDTSSGVVQKNDQFEIIQDLKNKKVDLIIIDHIFDGTNILENYIRAHFEQKESIHEFSVWELRE